MSGGTGSPALPPASPLRRLASFLSTAGHPFVLIPLTILAVTRSWFWMAVVATTTTLPMLFVILRKVRKGVWSDHDVSRHAERGSFYHVAFPLMAVAALAFHLLDAPSGMMRGLMAGVGMLAVGFAANRWLKVSVHMLFGTFCAVMLVRQFPATIPLIAVFLPSLAWSRRYLDRHTWPEIGVGLVTGLAGGMIAAW
jgi:hypothetical protein